MATWGPAVHQELYNLDLDPGERENLSGGSTAQLEEFTRILTAYKDYCQSLHQDVTTENLPHLSADDIEKLESLGYF